MTIDTFLAAHLDQYIAETSALCAIPSVSARDENLVECAALVASTLARHDFETEIFASPGAPIVVGRAQGHSARTLLFYNHYDVQPPEPLHLWTTPPFTPTVRNGALYARGAKDDKGELISRLAALDAVRMAHGGELPCGVTIVVEGQEEVGSPYIADFVRAHLQLLHAHGAIWEEGTTTPDGRPIIQLGARGILAVQFDVHTLKRDAHSGSASVLPNAAWRLLWAITSLKGPDERILIPGFYEGARPPSARDLELLATVPSFEAQYRAEFGVETFVRDASGDAFKRAEFEPTCNVQGIGAGYQGDGLKTIIPGQASAKVDFRLVPGQDPEDIYEKLRVHLVREGFDDIRVTKLCAMWPAKSDPDDPFVALTARAGEAAYGLPAAFVPLSGGSSPVYAFAGPLNIPVVTAGVGYPGSRVHAPDEHVRLTDFLAASRQVARIVDGFAEL